MSTGFRRKILIVEDEQIIAQDLASMVEHLGYEVSAILDSGQEAMEIAGKEHLDLALTDIVLRGEMDGVELASKLRLDHHLPVVFITAYSDRNTVDRAKLTEPLGYVLKPFDEKDIQTAIEVALYRGEMEQRLQEQQRLLEEQNKRLDINRRNLELERRRYRELFEFAPDGYIVTDLEGRVSDVNSAMCRLSHQRSEALVRRHAADLFSAEEREKITRLVRRAGTGLEEKIENVEACLLTHQGDRKVTCSLTLNAVRDSHGVIKGIRLLLHDISRRMESEQELRQSEERFRTTLYSINDAVITTEMRGLVTHMNRRAELLTGWPEREAAARKVWDVFVLVDEDSGSPVPDLCRRAIEEMKPAIGNDKTMLVARDGMHHPVAASASPIRSSTGRIAGAVLVFSDQTVRRQLQSQVLHSRKMEAIGTLAGGVAHDFNNMLGAILGYATRLNHRLHEADPLQKDVSAILDATQRCSNLTRKLLTLASKQFVAPVSLNLNESLTSLQQMLQSLVGAEIRLVLLPAQDLWYIHIDPTQVDQLLTNLAVNAREAIEASGTVTVETRNIVVDEQFHEDRLEAVPGEYVMLRFSDTGKGMDKEVMAHMYEPFFSTKPRGKGSGLGLATVFGIVRQNRGFIVARSEPGLGTSFEIFLPRAALAESRAPAAALESAQRGSETILIVEDEELLLEIVSGELEFLGYTIFAAHSPAEAIAIFEQHREKINLLLTDVIMPQMNGKRLADRLRLLKQDLKVVFMSGYTADVVAHRGIVEKELNFLPKPFTPTQLAQRIRMVLDVPGGAHS